MRVAIVTESFPPDVNGVANSVARMLPHLVESGHEPLVIAPQSSSGTPRLADPVAAEVVRLPAVSMPGYPGVRLALPGARVGSVLRSFRPDVVHLASPFVLGAWALAPASRLDVPIVAAYQTDIPAYTRPYRLGFTEQAAWQWIRAHPPPGRPDAGAVHVDRGRADHARRAPGVVVAPGRRPGPVFAAAPQ